MTFFTNFKCLLTLYCNNQIRAKSRNFIFHSNKKIPKNINENLAEAPKRQQDQKALRNPCSDRSQTNMVQEPDKQEENQS